MKGYGVNVHETKSQSIRGNTKQWYNADDSGQLSTKIYDKRDDFNFKIINFPNMCSNIPGSPLFGVF
jgi:hypothetical protein